MRRAVTVGAGLVLAVSFVPAGHALDLGVDVPPVVDRRMTDAAIVESSGLAGSFLHPSVLFTHNDSGDGPRVFAVNQLGQTQAVLRLKGARARDWEDIATGPNNTVWVGDIGDNTRSRSTISVYRFQEPLVLSTGNVAWRRFDLRYPDGRHNAEALLVRPDTGQLYVVTKQRSGAGIYRAPRGLSTSRVNTLRRVASAPSSVTAGAFAPRGGGLALRDYNRAYIYSSIGARPRVMRMPDQPQEESLTFSPLGEALLVGSERPRSQVWRVPLD